MPSVNQWDGPATAAADMASGALPDAVPDTHTKEITAVGPWPFLAKWQEHESRLWNDVLPKASGGKITAKARPLTELGMKGFELMRQLKVGVFYFAHGVTSYPTLFMTTVGFDRIIRHQPVQRRFLVANF